MSTSQLPPPGWYQDPAAAPGTLRWWDGSHWTVAVEHMAVEYPAPQLAGESQARVIPAKAAWWALLGLLVGEILGGILASLAALFTGSTTSAAATLVGEIGLWTGMLGAVVLMSRHYGTGSLRRDYGLGFRPADLGWGPLIAVIGIVLEGILGAVFSGSRFHGTNTQLITGQKGHTAGFAVITVVVAVGAPLVEELFFRGLIRTALRSAIGPGWAAVAQGALFGLAHADPTTGLGNVEVIVIIGSLGIVLGLFANYTGRLAAGMIGHSLFNLLATIAILAS